MKPSLFVYKWGKVTGKPKPKTKPPLTAKSLSAKKRKISPCSLELLKGPDTLVPHPCQLGHLQCVWFVIAEEYCDILAVFFTSFVLFVWALRPASLAEDDDEDGRGPASSDEDEDDEGRVPKRRARAPVAEARRGPRTTPLSERPDLPLQRRFRVFLCPG